MQINNKITRAHSERVNTPNGKYRPDIDGLRAIAVVSVVVFHAFPEIIAGGFVGVDIFFVISGFLISSIIFRSLEIKGFSLYEFYERRIRRIFPALIIVLTSSLALGWLTLLADEYKQLGKHVAGGAGFVSNYILWQESGYFDNSASTKPLLHLWSLGVEEQFYIFWPVLLWLTWKKNINPLFVIITVGLASFAYNVTIYKSDIVADFYAPQSRLWELISGAALAYAQINKVSSTKRSVYQPQGFLAPILKIGSFKSRDLQSTVGASLILASLLLITKERYFPGFWAMLPVLGTVLIISAGSQSRLNRSILSNRLGVWLGLISFPLYLWHWPLLSLLRVIEVGEPSRQMRLFVVGLSIVLAALTYYLVERPLRLGEHGRAKVALLLGVMILVGGSGYLVNITDGQPSRPIQIQTKALSAQFAKWNFKTNNTCTDKYSDAQLKFLVFCIANSEEPDLILFGDSHANQLYPGLVHAYRDQRGIISIGNGPPLDGVKVKFSKITDHPWQNGQQSYDLVLAKILGSSQIKTVVYAAHWEGPIHGRFVLEEHRQRTGDIHLIRDGVEGDNKSIFKAAFEKTLQRLLDTGKNVVVVIDSPEIMVNPRKCLRSPRVDRYCSFSRENVMQRQQFFRSFIAEMARKYPRIRVFDPVPTLCPTSTCRIHDGEHLIYKDLSHISEYSSDRVGVELRKFIDLTEQQQ